LKGFIGVQNLYLCMDIEKVGLKASPVVSLLAALKAKAVNLD
jgi:hypothetical protein